MKRNIFFLVLIGLTFFANAQEKGFYYGARFSLGESTLKGGGISNSKGKLFWQVGAASAYQINKHFGLTADFLLSGKGTKGSGETEEGGITGTRKYPFNEKVSLITGDVPLMVKVSTQVGNLYLKAFVGPSINFNFGGLYNKTYDDANYHKNNGVTDGEIKTLETMETSLIFGAGIDVNANDGRLFFLDFRINNSLGDIGTLYGKAMNSSYFGLSAGYFFH